MRLEHLELLLESKFDMPQAAIVFKVLARKIFFLISKLIEPFLTPDRQTSVIPLEQKYVLQSVFCWGHTRSDRSDVAYVDFNFQKNIKL